MVLKGSLGTFDIISVIQMITSQQATGVLHIKGTAKKDTFDIFIDNGRLVRIIPVFESSRNLPKNSAVVYIAERLAKAKLLEPGQLKVLMNAVKKEGLNEYDIPKRFSVSQSSVIRLIITISNESLHTMHHLKTGTYEFESTAIEYDPQFCEPMNAEFVLMESSRVVDEVLHLNRRYSDGVIFKKEAHEEPVQPKPEPPRKKEEIPDDFIIERAGTPVEKAATPVEKEQQEQVSTERYLSPQEIVLELINGKNTFTDIYESSLLSKNEVILELNSLLSKNKITVVSEIKKQFKPAKASLLSAFFHAARSVIILLLTIAVLLTILSYSRINLFRISTSRVSITYTNLLKYIGRYQQIKLSNALEIYKLEYGSYPASLKTLVDMHIISSKDLTFPYGSEYYYAVQGESYILLAPKYAAR